MCRIRIGRMHLLTWYCLTYRRYRTETNSFATIQTSDQFEHELYFSNESHNSNFLNETMGKTADDAYRYSYVVVIVFGILGNILVINSILRQKKLLKNNYYFLVLHLTICDLGPLIIFLFGDINFFSVEDRPVYTTSTKYCSIVFSTTYISFFE